MLGRDHLLRLQEVRSKIKDEPVVIMGAGGLNMALSVLRAMGGMGASVVDIDAESAKRRWKLAR